MALVGRREILRRLVVELVVDFVVCVGGALRHVDMQITEKTATDFGHGKTAACDGLRGVSNGDQNGERGTGRCAHL